VQKDCDVVVNLDLPDHFKEGDKGVCVCDLKVLEILLHFFCKLFKVVIRLKQQEVMDLFYLA
jgi:hypothetical protein